MVSWAAPVLGTETAATGAQTSVRAGDGLAAVAGLDVDGEWPGADVGAGGVEAVPFVIDGAGLLRAEIDGLQRLAVRIGDRDDHVGRIGVEFDRAGQPAAGAAVSGVARGQHGLADVADRVGGGGRAELFGDRLQRRAHLADPGERR